MFQNQLNILLVLRDPLILSENYSVSVIELPAPRAEHMYPTGLEHLGIVVGHKLPEFKEKYKNIITGEKDRRPYSMLPFITFDNGKTAKFYKRSLKQIVQLQGWKFQQL